MYMTLGLADPPHNELYGGTFPRFGHLPVVLRDDSVVVYYVGIYTPTTESNVSVQLVATSTKICTAGSSTRGCPQRFGATGTLFLLLQVSIEIA